MRALGVSTGRVLVPRMIGGQMLCHYNAQPQQTMLMPTCKILVWTVQRDGQMGLPGICGSVTRNPWRLGAEHLTLLNKQIRRKFGLRNGKV